MGVDIGFVSLGPSVLDLSQDEKGVFLYFKVPMIHLLYLKVSMDQCKKIALKIAIL